MRYRMFTAESSGEAHEMLQLNRAERLLVTAVRRLVLGWGMCTGIARELEVIGGPQATEVLPTLRIFLGTLDRTTRRRADRRPAGWFAPTVDERRILAMSQPRSAGMRGGLRPWCVGLHARRCSRCWYRPAICWRIPWPPTICGSPRGDRMPGRLQQCPANCALVS